MVALPAVTIHANASGSSSTEDIKNRDSHYSNITCVESTHNSDSVLCQVEPNAPSVVAENGRDIKTERSQMEEEFRMQSIDFREMETVEIQMNGLCANKINLRASPERKNMYAHDSLNSENARWKGMPYSKLEDTEQSEAEENNWECGESIQREFVAPKLNIGKVCATEETGESITDRTQKECSKGAISGEEQDCLELKSHQNEKNWGLEQGNEFFRTEKCAEEYNSSDSESGCWTSDPKAFIADMNSKVRDNRSALDTVQPLASNRDRSSVKADKLGMTVTNKYIRKAPRTKARGRRFTAVSRKRKLSHRSESFDRIEQPPRPDVRVNDREDNQADLKDTEGVNTAALTAGSPITKTATGLHPITKGKETWSWDNFTELFDPLTKESIDYLVQSRCKCADAVRMYHKLYPQRILRTDEDSICRQILATHVSNRQDRMSNHRISVIGRHYHDIWDEEDFLSRQQKLQEQVGPKQTIPFSKEHVLSSNRLLVHGYNDECFRTYIAQLESAVGKGNVTNSSHAPPINVQSWHAAASGKVRLQTQIYPYDVVHPAAVNICHKSYHSRDAPIQTSKTSPDRRRKKPFPDTTIEAQRAEELKLSAQASVCDDTESTESEFPEEDELFRGLYASQCKLMSLSMVNWRKTTRLLERCASHRKCQSILDQAELSKRQLEALYLHLYPPKSEKLDNHSLDAIASAQSLEIQKIRSRRSDLSEHSVVDVIRYVLKTTQCKGIEAIAVEGSILFAMRVQIGDEVDVIDQHGRWNQGTVLDSHETGNIALRHLKFRLSCWGDCYAEWIMATDARILPRGIATVNENFPICSIPGSHTITLTLQHAIALEKSFKKRNALSSAAMNRLKESIFPELPISSKPKRKKKCK